MKISPINELNFKTVAKAISKKPKKHAAVALGAVALGGVVYDKMFSSKAKEKKTVMLKEKAENKATLAYEKFDYVKDIALTSFELEKKQFKFGGKNVRVIPVQIFDTSCIVTEFDDKGNISRMSRLNSKLNPLHITEFKNKKMDMYEFDENSILKNITIGLRTDKNDITKSDESYDFELDKLTSIDVGKNHLSF